MLVTRIPASLAVVASLTLAAGCGQTKAASQPESYAPVLRFASAAWAAALTAAVNDARLASGYPILVADATLERAAVERASELVAGDDVVLMPGQDEAPTPVVDVALPGGHCAVEADHKTHDLLVTVTDQGPDAGSARFDARAVVRSWLARPEARRHLLWPTADAVGTAVYLRSTGLSIDGSGNEAVRFDAQATLLIAGRPAAQDECL